jgi:four helix bundle protein
VFVRRLEMKFRFQDLEIWKFGIEVSDQLFEIADHLEDKKRFRFAEQLRGAAMSLTNNIAEGSGSISDKEFKSFLNFARRSTFEIANILIILNRRKLLAENQLAELLDKLDKESRMITNFGRSL